MEATQGMSSRRSESFKVCETIRKINNGETLDFTLEKIKYTFHKYSQIFMTIETHEEGIDLISSVSLTKGKGLEEGLDDHLKAVHELQMMIHRVEVK